VAVLAALIDALMGFLRKANCPIDEVRHTHLPAGRRNVGNTHRLSRALILTGMQGEKKQRSYNFLDGDMLKFTDKYMVDHQFRLPACLFGRKIHMGGKVRRYA
jgi:hypothetical protein